jgi:Ras-related protein Rab-5C
MHYRYAQAAIVVYDATKVTSLEKAKTFAGNKIDLIKKTTTGSSSTSESEGEGEPDDATATPGEAGGSPALDTENVRQVSRDEAEAYAKEAGPLFFEISAKTGKGVVRVFTEIGASTFHVPRRCAQSNDRIQLSLVPPA